MKSTDRKLYIFIAIASFIAIFLSFDKYWAPFDEGIVTVAAERLIKGEIPYKDFFIVMYPPGQVYALGFLYKIFGVSLEIGRLYTVFVHLLIALCTFLMANMLTKNAKISLIVWVITLSSLAPRLGALPFPIWPGMAFSLFSLYFFMRYLEYNLLRYIIFSGLIIGLACLFRHDIGSYGLLSILISLFIYKRSFKELFLLGLSAGILPFLVIVYLVTKGAGRDIVESLVLFPFVHKETAVLPFPNPCFNPFMIFHGSLHFINVNQYYIPILLFVFIAGLLMVRFIKKHTFDKIEISILAIFIFGVLSFTQARIRPDPAHLLSIIYPSIVLFGFVLDGLAHGQGPLVRTKQVFIILMAFLFTLLTIKNVDKSFKNILRKPYKGDVILTKFARGSVYVPKEEKKDIEDVILFIDRNTAKDEKIYIGNMSHQKDDFGGSLILYTLCQRMPSTKYYEILPGLITERSVQEEIANSLASENVKYIVLQDIEGDASKGTGLSSGGYSVGTRPVPIAASTERPVPLELDVYIGDNFKLVKKFGKYNIYEKR